MARPIAPVAPVTSAVLAVRSNIISLRRKRESAHLLRRAHAEALRLSNDALDQAAEDLSGTELIECRHPGSRHGGDGFTPAYGTCHLSDEGAQNLLWVARRLSGDIGHHRHHRRI